MIATYNQRQRSAPTSAKAQQRSATGKRSQQLNARFESELHFALLIQHLQAQQRAQRHLNCSDCAHNLKPDSALLIRNLQKRNNALSNSWQTNTTIERTI